MFMCVCTCVYMFVFVRVCWRVGVCVGFLVGVRMFSVFLVWVLILGRRGGMWGFRNIWG